MTERLKRLLDKIEEALDAGEPWPGGTADEKEVAELCQDVRMDIA